VPQERARVAAVPTAASVGVPGARAGMIRSCGRAPRLEQADATDAVAREPIGSSGSPLRP
jgi:hypothetical protein